MSENYGIQQINDIYIRANSAITIGNRTFNEGECILRLQDIDNAEIRESKGLRSSSGGFKNMDVMSWLTHSDVSVPINRGIISKKDFNFLLDSQIVTKEDLYVSYTETLTINSNSKVKLKYVPKEESIYCYKENGDKIPYLKLENRDLTFSFSHINETVEVNYLGKIDEGYEYSINQDFLSNVIVSAEIHFSLKEDIDGEEYTGIVYIPTANIVGNMNLVMGRRATPIIGNFCINSIRSKTETRDKYCAYTATILDRDIYEI